MRHSLYYYPGNANLAPHILLEEAECEYDLVLVDRGRQAQRTDEYLRLNPNGTIPTLVSGSLVLFEAAAICLHIADQHPEACLAPPHGSLERAHFYKWMFFLSNTVQPAYMAFRYPEKHAALVHVSAQDSNGSHVLEAVRSSAAERTARAFDVIENSLSDAGPFMLGANYSACDAYLYMLGWWARKLPRAPAELPRIRLCIEAVASRNATKRACASERVDVYDPGA
jgi:glutathione S-transferase